ncbi:hypothetical protein Rsub_05620 [Raphidocelis subcapitata]|uniref:Wax synthase domain-containing protein n=1 Tax=Raphidocelis subcapitata TaxID=307507 RepID=A0A2V0P0A4_9CHLO|nr:hypothetical protein Rsub_05620 [Raphidocelis subcapitata]|eukprot:GBF93009.1 hypothetical protein Rsub_05620 [Raphidocelis subcapitata]
MRLEGYAAGLAARLLASYAAAAAAAAAVFLLARPLPPGSRGRAAVCVAVAAALLAAPSRLLDFQREAIGIVPAVGVFSLAAFKVLAFAVGRGPLQAAPLPSFAKFAAALALPVIPIEAFKLSSRGGARPRRSPPPPPPARAASAGEFLASYAAKSAATAAVIGLYRLPGLPVLALHWLYALCLSLSMGALWDAYCAAAVGLYGLRVARSFDAPRWNLTTSHMLRVLIYEPVLEGRLVPAGIEATPQTAGETAGAARNGGGGGGGPEASDAPAAAAESDGGGAPFGESRSSSPAPEARLRRAGAGDAFANGGAPGGRRGQPPAGDAQEDGPTPGSKTPPAAAAAAAAATAPSAGGGRGPRRGRLLRRAAALQATFAFSGLWHAFIWAHFHGTSSLGWRWFVFFSVQAPIMVAEAALQHLWLAKWRLPPPPRAVSVLLTNFLLIVVAEPFFFGPCDASGMCARMMGSLQQAVAAGGASA